MALRSCSTEAASALSFTGFTSRHSLPSRVSSILSSLLAMSMPVTLSWSKLTTYWLFSATSRLVGCRLS